MCWSQEASLALAVAGFATAGYAAKKGETRELTIPLAYFAAMELLQFFAYFYVDQCTVESNQILTFLSYVHIAFQPLFINMMNMPHLDKPLSYTRKLYVYGACLVATAIMLIKLVPTSTANMCKAGQTLCGETFCTISGNWHIGWSVPFYNSPIPGDFFIYYALAVFVLPFFYGGWRGVLFLILGPIVALATTTDPHEWPAVWCLFSVALILVLMIRRLKNYR